MQADLNLIFSGINGIPQSLAGSGNIPSTGVYDIAEGLMLTAGTYDNPIPGLKYSALSPAFGEDIGVGQGNKRIEGLGRVGTAFIGPGILNVALQGAVDNLGGVIAGLTFTTYVELGPTMTAAQLTANVGFNFPGWPRRQIFAAGQDGAMPRFFRLLYQITNGGFSQGTISFAGFPLMTPTHPVQYYGGGFIANP